MARWLSWLERCPVTAEVRGSSPLRVAIDGDIRLNIGGYLSAFIKLMDGFPSGQRGQTVNLLATLSVVRIHLHPVWEKSYQYRGVEQLEARRAHNPEVVGSNPSPAILPR